jgi:hypothetical protein
LPKIIIDSKSEVMKGLSYENDAGSREGKNTWNKLPEEEKG